MGYPETRLRRLRQSRGLRQLTDAPWPGAQKFIWPVFCVQKGNGREAIQAMPGQYRLGVESLKREVEESERQGIGGILIFGIPGDITKTPDGVAAYRDDAIVPSAIRAVKEICPSLPVFTDVCLCAYTDHGHCGPLNDEGKVDNDATLKILSEVALSHARAGADAVSPSAMMDGQVQAIRHRLDEEGFTDTIIMSYSTKFASSLYEPFREAGSSAPGHGDRMGYQQSYRYRNQALSESLEDAAEGADILMVKPALWYLDIIHNLKEKTLRPIAAYNVSGEYSMLHASATRGWGHLKSMVQESLSAIERSGADIIISYWARYYDRYFQDGI